MGKMLIINIAFDPIWMKHENMKREYSIQWVVLWQCLSHHDATCDQMAFIVFIICQFGSMKIAQLYTKLAEVDYNFAKN